MQVSFEVHGLNELFGTIGNFEKAERAYLEQVYSLITDEVRKRTPIDVVTPKGKAKEFGEHIQESWIIAVNPTVTTIFTDVEYGETLEEGLYKKVGPRTAASAGGIYSKQAVGGMVKPLIDDEETIEGMLEMAKKKLPEFVKAFFGD